MNKRKKHLLRILSMCCIFIMTLCIPAHLALGHKNNIELTAWLVDWDMEQGLKEYGAIKNKVLATSYFAAHFDENGIIHIPESVQKARLEDKYNKIKYLSIVNDVYFSDGKRPLVKDLAILHKVLADDEKMALHVEDIVHKVKKGGYDGIEIDYERIFKDKSLIQQYMRFTYQLFRAARREGLQVRFILEPSMPFDAGFCKGAEYVVMLYNLYGTHSGPGPKADEDFIAKTIEKMKALPENKSVALATGGCMWIDYDVNKKGKARFIDEKAAVDLAKKNDIKPLRDEKSSALYFNFSEKGHNYEVWYADKITLENWIKIAEKKGIKTISLWRLGGNESLDGIEVK